MACFSIMAACFFLVCFSNNLILADLLISLMSREEARNVRHWLLSKQHFLNPLNQDCAGYKTYDGYIQDLPVLVPLPLILVSAQVELVSDGVLIVTLEMRMFGQI